MVLRVTRMATKLKSRITTTARGIVFFVIMKILHLRILILNHSQLLEMPKSAKVRVMPINLPILASPLPGKEMLPLRKQAIKVLQTALNRDYGAGLDVDGIWGTNTEQCSWYSIM